MSDPHELEALVAKAIYMENPSVLPHAARYARAAISAINASGIAKVAPVVATDDMLFAMGQAANFHIPVGANRAAVWSAMISAVEG